MTWRVPVYYKTTGIAYVNASTAEEAVEKVEEGEYDDILHVQEEEIAVGGDPVKVE